jgi:hypothetical protein
MPRKGIIDFTLGADPEMLCHDGREVIVAGEVVGDEDSQFGVDGNGINFELRPNPSKDPLKIVSNIRDILLSHPEYSKYNFLAGSYKHNYALGGHIHFGIKSDKIHQDTATPILSQYLGSLGILVEDKYEARARRFNGGYGGFSDNRAQDHGFEYRTLSSWLTSPYIAAAFLCLAKTIMYEVLNNPKFSPQTFIEPDDINCVKLERILNKFPEIWKSITKMRLYQSYKPYIDLFYYLIQNKKTWFVKGSVNAAWGLFDSSGIDTTKFGIDTFWGGVSSLYARNNNI